MIFRKLTDTNRIRILWSYLRISVNIRIFRFCNFSPCGPKNRLKFALGFPAGPKNRLKFELGFSARPKNRLKFELGFSARPKNLLTEFVALKRANHWYTMKN